MADRKQTPDILGAILGENPPAPTVSAVVPKPARQRLAEPAPRVAAVPPKPIQWQYMVVSLQDYRGWRPRYIDGAEVEDWMRGPLLHEYLAQLAEEGWELAGACSGQHMYGMADNYQIFLKMHA